jgi:hypothetical protein
MKKIQLFQRRDFGATLNASAEFITQNFRNYSKAFLYFVMPPLLLLIISVTYLFIYFAGSYVGPMTSGPDALKRLVTWLPLIIVFSILFSAVYLIQTLLSYEYLISYELKEDPATITTEELWGRIKANMLRLISSYLGLFLIFLTAYFFTFLIGFMLFRISGFLGGLFVLAAVIGWIYMLIPVSLFFMVRLREGLGNYDSLRRCFVITTGHWWRTFGIMLVVAIVAWLMKMMFVAPFSLLNWLLTTHQIGINPSLTQSLWLAGVIQSLSVAVSLYFSALVCFATGFNYYSLVESMDNTSLLNEIDHIGERPDRDDKQEGEF